MSESNKAMCRVPVRATYRVINHGDPVLVDAEYEDIPAKDIARFLMQRLGGHLPEVEDNRIDDR